MQTLVDPLCGRACCAGSSGAKLRIANPLLDFRHPGSTAISAGAASSFFAPSASLYANTTALPGLLQSLFGYDATTSGLVLSPAGFGAVMVLFVGGMALSRGTDARYLMAGGLFVMAVGNYWMAQLNLSISPWQVVWPRVVVIAGLSMLFAPLNVAAFATIPVELRGAAVGLLALLRNEGGSVGTSLAQTIQQRREQFHTLRLNESLDPFNPAVTEYLSNGQKLFYQHNGDWPLAGQQSIRALANVRHTQAASLAYFDVFWACAVVGVVLLLPVFFMRRSVAAKGEHIAAE